MTFEIIGEINLVETIASGNSVRVRHYLNQTYGRGRWRKVKGFATIQFSDGVLYEAEIHWYEAHGIGRKQFKIKRIIS